MTTRVVEDEYARKQLVKFIENLTLPFSITIVKGKHRSLSQNRLQRQWLNEISEQLGDSTPEEVRGYCKLHFGVPILREENAEFHKMYDKVLKPLGYEDKLAIMMEPLDLPVTRLMTTAQHKRYLDEIHHHFTEQGLVLTEPDK